MFVVETNYHHHTLVSKWFFCRFVRESETLGLYIFHPISYLNNHRIGTLEWRDGTKSLGSKKKIK